MPQSASTEHTCPSIKQFPPTGGHCALLVQTALFALQRALRSQSGLVAKHTALSIVQRPAWSGQPALF
jgi:hypothetical protein